MRTPCLSGFGFDGDGPFGGRDRLGSAGCGDEVVFTGIDALHEKLNGKLHELMMPGPFAMGSIKPEALSPISSEEKDPEALSCTTPIQSPRGMWIPETPCRPITASRSTPPPAPRGSMGPPLLAALGRRSAELVR